jgi:hypothetical protein
MAKYFDTKVFKKDFGESPERNSGGRLSCAGPFENVSRIGVIELERTRQVGVPGTRPGESSLGCGIAGDLAGGHDVFPIRPVPILDHHRDRTADGLSVPHTGEKTYLVPFNFHAAASTIPSLSPFEFVVDEFEIDGKVSRNAFDERDQSLAMRLTGRSEAQHRSSIS